MSARTQRWNPENYRSNAVHVHDIGQELIAYLQPRAGERILDLGCGEGWITLQLVQLGASVVGVDSSRELVADARGRGLDARLMDGENLTFEAEFDAVYSNAALHWMRDADAVIAGVRRALKPKGRFVASFCAHGHAAAVHTALIASLERRGIDGAARMSWYLPTPEEYRTKLETHGFVVEATESTASLTPLAAGMLGLLETFYGPFVEGLDDTERSKVFNETLKLLAPSLRDRQGEWAYDAVRLRCRSSL